MINKLKFTNFKGTWLELPSIMLFCIMCLFICFFITSKTISILEPIMNYFTFVIAMTIIWPYIIIPILDRFSDWFTDN